MDASSARLNSTHGQRLSDMRNALLNLHKVLVDSERVRYEKVVGAISSPNQFLHLVTNDPWFAWLHPISQLIVSMDEAIDGEEPLTPQFVEALGEQSRALLVASESGEGFARHYYDALQEDPDVVLAHAAAVKIIGRPAPAKPDRTADNGGGA